MGSFETLKKTRQRQPRAADDVLRVRPAGCKKTAAAGTDHGAGSCLFLAGPSVKAGVVGKHPSLADLDADDLKFHTDFRRVYATLLDGWLGCDSKAVLGGKWEHVKELETQGLALSISLSSRNLAGQSGPQREAALPILCALVRNESTLDPWIDVNTMAICHLYRIFAEKS